MAWKAYPKSYKEKALRLRKKGESLKEIAETLSISKSTAKLWTQSVALSPALKKALYKSGLKKMHLSPNNSHNRRQRELGKIEEEAKKEIALPLSDSAEKIIGAALYWAEGEKKLSMSISNSDPVLIHFFVKWLKKHFGTKASDLKANLNIYSQQNELKLKKFWSDLTEIPLQNFGKSYIKPKNKKFKKSTLYYGTIKVRVPKGADMKHRVASWMKTFLTSETIDVKKVESRWENLRTQYPREV